MADGIGSVLDFERLGPNGLAERCEARLVELGPLIAKAKGERLRRLKGQARSCRSLLLFARTRAGYVPKAKRSKVEAK